MGFLMEKELKYLGDELAQPARPFLVILGGSKVSDKIGVIKALMEKADTILICGAMANTFLEAEGIHMGSSRVERDKLDLARELIELAKQKNVRLLLPIDLLGAEEIKPGAATRHSGRISHDYNIPDGWQAVDIGPETITLFKSEIARAKTILWNGPPGIFEIREFSAGTEALAEALAESNAITIIGGGDSVTAVKQAGLADKMTFISTGGGASLELIEGKNFARCRGLNGERCQTEECNQDGSRDGQDIRPGSVPLSTSGLRYDLTSSESTACARKSSLRIGK